MKTAYCTHCRKVTTMRSAIAELPTADRKRTVKKTVIERYHCSLCGLFVCSTMSTDNFKKRFQSL